MYPDKARRKYASFMSELRLGRYVNTAAERAAIIVIDL